MNRLGIALASLLAMASPALAQPVMALLSSDRVEITSNFTGADLTVFGALEFDRELRGVDLIVLLRGPDIDLTTRRMERVLGLWLNRSAETFEDVPAFYAIHSSRPLADIADPARLAAGGLGFPSIVQEPDLSGRRDDFAAALVRLQQRAGLYSQNGAAILRPSETIFRTTFELPADVPTGNYAVEIHLFEAGAPIAVTTLPLEIAKSGTEQFIFDASKNQSWLYAIAIIAIAMFSGWLGNLVFRQD
jgi:uncharacterized protein (TIGR02186 family)